MLRRTAIEGARLTNHVFATMFVTLRADFQPVERRNCRQDSTKQARKHPNGSRCDRCSIENPPWEIKRILRISAAETTVKIQPKKNRPPDKEFGTKEVT
jgi:hypothetical protein